MNKKISLSILLIILVGYIYLSLSQIGKDLIQVRIIKRIQCKDKTSTGYGYQRATSGSKTTNCLYLSDKGYIFTTNKDLKENQNHTEKSYFVYSDRSRVFKELLYTYDLNPIN